MTQLHSDWAPSSMSRLLSCPGSAELVKLFVKEDNDAANLGTIAHGVLEDCLTFGTKPDHQDMEINEGIELSLDWIKERLNEYPDVELHVEKRLAIPETPVWGTADIVMVSPKLIHITDYKHGYLPIEVRMNAQLLSYLAAAIAEFGSRKKYLISVIQPRYHHIEGPIRTYEVQSEDLDWFAGELRYALANRDKLAAGNHCKYCPARGACEVFAGYVAKAASKAIYYDLTDAHTFGNETMAKLLELADLLPGWITELRKEALKRVMNDQTIEGFKVVKGRATREFVESAPQLLPEIYKELGMPEEALYESSFISPATAESQVKSMFRGRNAWKEPWKKVNDLITSRTGPPSLVKSTDGRPMFKRGDEFDELPDPTDGEILL